MMALPMYALYEAGCYVARAGARKARGREEDPA